MLVEADEYELPLAVADSAVKLAEMVGVTKSAVEICVKRNCDGSISGRKYIKVENDDL